MPNQERYRPGRGRQLLLQAPCVYPGCQQYVEVLPGGGGRPRNFCSDSCRANFHNIQRQLLVLLDAIRVDRQDCQNEGRLAELDRNLALAEAHLARFRELAVH